MVRFTTLIGGEELLVSGFGKILRNARVIEEALTAAADSVDFFSFLILVRGLCSFTRQGGLLELLVLFGLLVLLELLVLLGLLELLVLFGLLLLLVFFGFLVLPELLMLLGLGRIRTGLMLAKVLSGEAHLFSIKLTKAGELLRASIFERTLGSL
uniref:Uncharacterized protein n=1 Tax=Cacopsylla melanoneura TaxID=428564 RepID=A0A8D8U2B6_9HEMI